MIHFFYIFTTFNAAGASSIFIFILVSCASCMMWYFIGYDFYSGFGFGWQTLSGLPAPETIT